jgi:hypothetical protein
MYKFTKEDKNLLEDLSPILQRYRLTKTARLNTQQINTLAYFCDKLELGKLNKDCSNCIGKALSRLNNYLDQLFKTALLEDKKRLTINIAENQKLKNIAKFDIKELNELSVKELRQLAREKGYQVKEVHTRATIYKMLNAEDLDIASANSLKYNRHNNKKV